MGKDEFEEYLQFLEGFDMIDSRQPVFFRELRHFLPFVKRLVGRASRRLSFSLWQYHQPILPELMDCFQERVAGNPFMRVRIIASGLSDSDFQRYMKAESPRQIEVYHCSLSSFPFDFPYHFGTSDREGFWIEKPTSRFYSRHVSGLGSFNNSELSESLEKSFTRFWKYLKERAEKRACA